MSQIICKAAKKSKDTKYVCSVSYEEFLRPQPKDGSAQSLIDPFRRAFAVLRLAKEEQRRIRLQKRDKERKRKCVKNKKAKKADEGKEIDATASSSPEVMELDLEEEVIETTENDEETAERWRKAQLLSHLLAIGLNETTRALEHGQLEAVLAMKDATPTTLVSHLPSACAILRCPLLPLSAEEAMDIAVALGLKSLVCLGLKKDVDLHHLGEEERTAFESLRSDIRKIATIPKLPFMEENGAPRFNPLRVRELIAEKGVRLKVAMKKAKEKSTASQQQHQEKEEKQKEEKKT